MSCNVCESSSMESILSLPNYPLNSVYLSPDQIREEIRYSARDFSMLICTKCGHFQGFSSVELKELYNDEYNYNTKNEGVQGRINYFISQLEQIKDLKFNRIIDVGCYDLSLLKNVKKKFQANYYIGIDPSIPNKLLQNDDQIICFKDYVDDVDIPYFDSSLPDLVISDQTFEHIPDIKKTLGNISNKVGANSIFAVCVPSMEVLIEKLNYHNLIHEHVNYFTINTLANLFYLNRISLLNYNLNYTSTCGFLFGLFKKGTLLNGGAVTFKVYTKEHFLSSYEIFSGLLERSIQISADISGEAIYGFGASDITANLGYFMKSDLSFLKYIIDDTSYKQGKFYPTLKPQIVSREKIDNMTSSNCFITAPQASRYIYARLNSFNFKRIINPIGIIA